MRLYTRTTDFQSVHCFLDGLQVRRIGDFYMFRKFCIFHSPLINNRFTASIQQNEY